ncbi:MAG: CoA transferase [Rhodospirillales bacterium]
MPSSENPNFFAGPFSGPLAGLRVVELGTTIAGPFCARLMADFGAEVIKIEPATGDPVRASSKRIHTKSLYAASLMRNKALIALNLKSPQGQKIVKDLVAKSDIVVENYKPGALERWGLGYEDLIKINPGLIMTRISGYGQTGPYSDRRGYGVVCEAVSGLRSIIGEPDRPPSRVTLALTDYITGLYGAFGTVMAMVHKLRTGKGQYIDLALSEAAFSFMEPYVPAYDKLQFVPQRSGARLIDSAVNNLFASKSGEFVHIQGSQDAGFARLVKAIGKPELAEDERFQRRVNRAKNQDQIDDIIQSWTGQYEADEIIERLGAHDIPSSRVNTIADVFGDPHFQARDMLHETPDGELGTVKLAGIVPKLSLTPGEIRHAGGRVGQDTRDVLSTLLGYRDVEIDKFESEGVVFCNDAAAQAVLSQGAKQE